MLPLAPAQHDAGDGGHPGLHGDWEVMRSQPALQAGGVACQLDLVDPQGSVLMIGLRPPWQGRAVAPLDEERQRRVGDGLLHPRQPPPQHLAVLAAARARGHRQSQPAGDHVELLRTHGPAQRPAGGRRGDPAPERAAGGLGRVDRRDQLQVGVAERHDPVGRSPARMPAAGDRRKTVARLELAAGGIQVGDRDQDVVELDHVSLSRAPTDVAGLKGGR